jgi:hypothetical protein
MSDRLRVALANGETYHLDTAGYEAKVAIFGFNARQPPFAGDFLSTEEGMTISRNQIASICVVDGNGNLVQVETPDFMRQLGWA